MRAYLSAAVVLNIVIVLAALVVDRSSVYVNPLAFVLVSAAGNLALDLWTTRRRVR